MQNVIWSSDLKQAVRELKASKQHELPIHAGRFSLSQDETAEMLKQFQQNKQPRQAGGQWV
ncbi:hypothetical protein [Paenibacillus sp. MBLB4367]|uniref:hypothetical protein n=1 Tax=Paenibacillus sp. MBLB4367 TaxID=3384767 RepID=UPI003907F1AA